MNVKRLNEAVATDTFSCDTAAVGSGAPHMAQFFVGRESLFISIYGMKSGKEFVNTREDEIRKRGAMDKLISGRGSNEISLKVLDVFLRHLCIEDWQSEPYYQQQNFAERHYQLFKDCVTRVMDRSGAPSKCWLLCCQYVAYILNRVSNETLDGKTPYSVLHGNDPDISMIPLYTFYQVVYFKHYGPEHFPSKSPEAAGRFVGFTETVGHALTFKVLRDSTSQIRYRSRLRTALEEEGEENLRAQSNPAPPAKNIECEHGPEGLSTSGREVLPNGNPPPPTDPTSLHDLSDFFEPTDQSPDPDVPPLPLLTTNYERRMKNGELMFTWRPEELIGRTFRLQTSEDPDAASDHSTIIECVDKYYTQGLAHHPELLRFRCKVNDKELDKLISYAQILKNLEPPSNNPDKNFQVDLVVVYAHRGPLQSHDIGYMGSSFQSSFTQELTTASRKP
jgi:hypothetical protein